MPDLVAQIEHQEDCHMHVHTVCSLPDRFVSVQFLLDLPPSIFANMPGAHDTCCICSIDIRKFSHGRTITSKQLERLKPYACREIHVGVDRGHITCVLDPHKHLKNKVGGTLLACKDVLQTQLGLPAVDSVAYDRRAACRSNTICQKLCASCVA